MLYRILVFAFLVASSVSWSQDPRGAIVGRVTDASGAGIPNAPVEVTNKAMGTRLSLSTNEVGLYQATYLIPGSYQIAVEAPGFKRVIRDNVEVRVNDRLEINVALEVGAQTESVTVTAESPVLNTGSASLGTVVDGRRISELPIAHGNPYQLIALAPGVAFARDPRLDRPFEPTHIVGYTMNGTKANRSDVTIDGAPSTATANANEVTSSYVPPADIVGEFKVQTATFDASFGQTEGGVTNISIKSGTNNLHGSAYYTKMAPGLFANDYFANASRTPRPDFTYDRWGGHTGGPVFIPKVYDGRNKTFFLWGYEGIHESRPRNNGVTTVPTEKMKTGDFSELLALGNQYRIYNPFTRRLVGGRIEADPFTDNVIPGSLFDPVARNIVSYFPKPLSEGNTDKTNNYQRSDLVENIKYYTHTARVDHVINDRHRLFVRGSVYRRDSDYNNYFNNLATGSLFQFLSRSGVIDHVYTMSPTTVLNLRYGYNRFIRVDNMNPEANGFDLTSLGFPAALNNAISEDIRRFPRIDFPSATYQGTGFGADFRPNDTHAFTATLQRASGSHFLKGGMEFRAYRENSIPTGNDQSGRYSFETTYTRGPNDTSAAAPGNLGQPFAALLLGLPSGSNSHINRPASYAEQSQSWGFFVHDDWSVSRRLTLNIGLRWEFEMPLTERFNRSVRGFDPNAVQPFEAQALARYAQNPTPEIPAGQFQARGGLTFPGVGGEPRGLYNTPKRNLMPRFGFAYKLSEKTVVRGGYGIFFGFLGQRRGDVVTHGFSRQTPFIATNDSVNFITRLSNPFPNGILEPVGSAGGAETFVGQPVLYFNENPQMPYNQRWQIGFQRELPGSTVVELGYTGNRGTHIEIPYNLNATPREYLSESGERDNARIAYLGANVPNPFAGILPPGATSALAGSNIARERLLRPFPHFDTITTTRYDGYSWYHGLQARLEKRFSKGLLLAANYTYSKFMQASELMYPVDPRPTELISDMDYPHSLNISGIWELPFGSGKRLLANVHPVASKIVSGWQLNGIYVKQSGAPVQWAYTTSNNVFGQTLNINSVIFRGNFSDIALDENERTVGRWFDTDAGFERSAPAQLDTNRQLRTFPLRLGSVRGDSLNNFDFGLFKNTRVAEGKDVQFRAEFLNAFNHPRFPSPSGNAVNPTNATFGRITAANQSNYARRIQLSLKFIF
jgi:hypothetical protein